MIVSIHQPNHLPYLGFLHKAALSDIFIVYDTAQYSTNDFQNRNKIKTPQGLQWITMPVSYSLGEKINEVKLVHPEKTLRKNWQSIEQNYKKAPYFEQYAPKYKAIFEQQWTMLSPFNEALITALFEDFGIICKIVNSSDLPPLQSKSTQALIDLTKVVGGDEYLSGPAGKEYLITEFFEQQGVKLSFQEFHHPKYPQLHGEFLPYACALDLLFNCGEKSKEILTAAT